MLFRLLGKLEEYLDGRLAISNGRKLRIGELPNRNKASFIEYEPLLLLEKILLFSQWDYLHTVLAQRNPFIRYSLQGVSQYGLDGLTIEVITRLQAITEVKTFLEFGSGDGTENNSLPWLYMGMSGGWVDLKKTIVDVRDSNRLNVISERISRDNCNDIYDQQMAFCKCIAGVDRIDIFSIDLDGNDFHILQKLLEHSEFSPYIIVIEYNGTIVPPGEFIMEYNEAHEFVSGTGYYGASYWSYYLMLKKYGYFPVVCDMNGVNAIYVKTAYRSIFEEVPYEARLIYNPQVPGLSGMPGVRMQGKTVLSNII